MWFPSCLVLIVFNHTKFSFILVFLELEEPATREEIESPRECLKTFWNLFLENCSQLVGRQIKYCL